MDLLGFLIVLEIKHLVLFDYGLFDKICDRIKYLLSERSGVTISFNRILEKSGVIHIILYLLKKY